MKGKSNPRRESQLPAWLPCTHCKQPIVMDACGTQHRNHCNWCLWSRHVDNTPGDRAADCGGAMEPVALWTRRDGEWAIIHRCCSCGELHSNRIAGDDDEQALIRLALAAITQPPFPLDVPNVVDTLLTKLWMPMK